MTSEFQRVALLRTILDPQGRMIGDDCAVLDARGLGVSPLVWSIDASVEHVHFERAWMSLEDIGWRATMAAFSDLAAMGAEPLGALSALTLPLAFTDDELSALARGQKQACDAAGSAIVGGNLARGPALSITTTVLGTATRPLTRRASSPGAGVFVAGTIGLAAAGLFDAQRAPEQRGSEQVWGRARRAFRRPQALLAEGRAAAQHGSLAAIDVSDGLAADAGHIAQESGVALVIEELSLTSFMHELPIDPAFDRREAVRCVGEDYALIAIAAELPPPFVRIGTVESDRPTGVYVRDAVGAVSAVARPGFDHFK